MNSTIDISCDLQPFDTIIPSITLTGFIFNQKINEESNNYIVTTHHGLPINKCYYENTKKLKIIHNCVWNELLILKYKDIPNTVSTFKKKKYKIPKTNETLYIKNKDRQIEINNPTPIFLKLFDIPTNPSILYLKCNIINSGEIVQSMSGSPVFDSNDFIVGILSKKSAEHAYIIPIYILVKTLLKKNNNSIFNLDCDELINKLNNIKIKNNLINHKSLNMLLPLSTYLMIEGDDNLLMNINNRISLNCIKIDDQLHINNSSNLISKNNKYLLNIRLLKLIKICFSDIILQIYNYLKINHNKKIYLYINKEVSNSNMKNVINYSTEYNEKRVKLKVFTE